MPAMDMIHDAVKNALIKAGWTITHDPFPIAYGGDRLYADLAAERPLAAERGAEKIIVEVKSFIGRSVVHDFYEAFGPIVAPEYKLYLAVSSAAYDYDLNREMIRHVLAQEQVPMIIVHTGTEEIVAWIR